MNVDANNLTFTQWARRLVSGKPHFVIGGTEDPYLLRWFVIPRNHYLNLYLHKFLRSDDDRALHDHPWWFVSIILKGGYYEHSRHGIALRTAPSIAYRPATHTHRVELHGGPEGSGRENEEEPCWTLIVTGPKRRHWGFWCPKGFVPWERFVAKTPEGSETTAGCGEYS